jgi:FixJ family two-component response regulator
MVEQGPTVFVVDDDVSVREAIKRMLESVGLRARTFESTRAFLDRTPCPGPNCLVLDVRLPGVSGIEFQNELSKANIQIPVVFITGFGDIPMSVRAMKAGAIEFLTKPFRDQDLLDAIQRALAQDELHALRRAECADLRQRFTSLTKRECEVMALVVEGKPNREIAAELGTSEVTVKIHRGRVMHKMRAKSTIDLARMAQKLGISAAP